MSNDKKVAPKAPAATAPVSRVKKAAGTISYNRFLNSWRCVNARGRLMLSTGSLTSARKAYPNYEVKE